MKTQPLGSAFARVNQLAELDLLVPFTTPELTRAAIRAAERFALGLNAAIRLLKVQVVPYQTEMSPVHLGFLKEQLESFRSELPLHPFILLTRDEDASLLRTLQPGSIVILASKRRLWRTRPETLAARIRNAGHKVILVYTRTTETEKEPRHA